MFISYFEEILKEIKSFQDDSDYDYLVYRGQADCSWNLRPSLFVKQLQKSLPLDKLRIIENNIHFDFSVNAKGMLDPKSTSWENLFSMRHFGLPTRILDWTENLNIAIYFAAYGNGDSPCIWLLNPHKLNLLSLGSSDLLNPTSALSGIKEYEEAFISTELSFVSPYQKPFAIIAPRMSDRIFAQRGLFTVQTDNGQMIDEMLDLSGCVKKKGLIRAGGKKK